MTPDVAAQIFNIVLAQIDAVQQNLSGGWIVKTRDEFDNRGFALAVLADERDAFAGFHAQIEAVQDMRSVPGY